MLPPASPLLRLAGKANLRRARLRVLVPSDGYHVQSEVVRALRTLGHDAVAVDLRPPASNALPAHGLQRLSNALLRYRPDLVVSINTVGFDRVGILDGILAALDLPCAVWFVDHPLFFGMGHLALRAPATQLFAWDKTHVAALRARSERPVSHLPLGCEPERFGAALARPADGAMAVSFVGSSMVALTQQWRGRLSEEERRAGEAVVAPLLAGEIDIHALTPTPGPPVDRQVLVAAYAHCLASRARRRRRLQALDQGALCLFGDDGMRSELPGRRLLGEVAYGKDLALVYRRSAINFNATILQMPTGVNQRCFDVPAAGGFLVTDAQSELFELFERDEEVVSYRDERELQSAVAHYGRDAKARAAISQRARQRICREHRYAHRLDRLLTIMRQA